MPKRQVLFILWCRAFFITLFFILGFTACHAEASKPSKTQRLNIVFILCDDLGYGDVACNNPQGKIATPRLDRLAAEGMRFTDAHTTSSVCTPTRYSVLTGRYNWRSRLQRGVLGGLSPRLIEPGRMTVAEMLRRAGYHTACIGKWHLGMNWARKKDPEKKFADAIEKGKEGWNIDFTRPITGGPNAVGFDTFFGIAASLDMVPYTFIENDRVTALPTVDRAFPMMPGKKGTTRRGPGSPKFEAIDVLPTLTRKAVEYIAQRASPEAGGKPFFLYLPYASPHTPTLPSPEWQGRSGLNPYADFVMQNDACVGQVLDALAKHGLADNTLVVFTSDNGCSPWADFETLGKKGHDPSYIYRGHKADIWDGGHRVPFIVRWPGKVSAGTTSGQLVSLVDFMATCADITGTTLPEDAAEDSVSLLPVLLGKAAGPVREALVHHSIQGKFSIRQGRWKLELCPGSGGWSEPRDPKARKQGLPSIQLYDISADPAERHNVQADHPDVVKSLTTLLQQYVTTGRSTPGTSRKNDGKVDIWKRNR
ncbi:MAG: arylsulfatase [Pirellulales bacterium]|nr:arylsulfatase [Pirellulales bacterium]